MPHPVEDDLDTDPGPATGLTVYFNGACPVCRAGIERQRDRMAACEVDWLDVNAAPHRAGDTGAALETVRERLHVKTADGTVLVGAPAFAALFAHTPGQRWLARLLRLPGLRTLADMAYRLFARALYRWNRAKGHW